MRAHVFAVGLVLTLGLVGCNDAGGAAKPVVDVFAAASLTDAFQDVAELFVAANPGVEIKFNFLASSDLATQIIEGAQADVFASADQANMAKVTNERLARDAQVFVLNRLSIVVAAGNPEDIAGLADLQDDGLVISLCNQACPAGRYALEAFDKSGVSVAADSLEADVRGVLTRVSLGEADAGIVYATDIAAADGVEAIVIPESDNVVATYPIAALVEAIPEAQEFVAFVRSEEAQQVFEDYGFGSP